MAQFDLPMDELVAYRPVIPEPADFDEFWRSTLAEAAAHDLSATFTPYDALLPEVRVFDVRFAGYAGQTVAAWFLTPAAGGGPRPCVVNYIGYGGGRGRPHDWLIWPAAGYSVLVMDSRGQGDGDTEDLPGLGPQHKGLITRGVLDKSDYYYRRLFTDAVRAFDVARQWPEVDPERVVVAGGSQGGALAQVVAGLRADVAGALIEVPFLTHFQRSVEITDGYPYRELADLLRSSRDKVDRVFRTLSYFDGLHFAARGTAPALYTVALMDDVCPPSTVYAAYNRYRGPKRMQIWPFNGHESGESFQVPISLRWLRDLFAG
jgi:cephalosporin-C deacetylase